MAVSNARSCRRVVKFEIPRFERRAIFVVTPAAIPCAKFERAVCLKAKTLSSVETEYLKTISLLEQQAKKGDRLSKVKGTKKGGKA